MKKDYLFKSIIIICAFLFSINLFADFETDYFNQNSGTELNMVSENDKILENLPEITFPINDTNKAYKGYILISSSEPQGSRNYLIILDYKGNVVKWKATNPFPFNFRLQPNGQFAYSESISGVATQAVARILDENLNLLKSYQCGNGYNSFPSEFLLLPNGNVLMVALDAIPVNMRDVNPNGDPNANVLGSVVQELDKDGNVVFQWRSWDYTDITETYENLTLSSFRTLHLNAMELDRDGNYLFSIRHFSQIIKVNRNTGEIMWRLGGKKNEFKFIGEHEEFAPLYFSYQHDIRRQPNGNITFFDNGNLKPTPQFSRAVEYKLDEQKKTAELFWEYRNKPDIYAPTRGSIQFLPNGNYLVGCGSSSTSEKLSAVELIPSTNEVVMSYVLPPGFESYRTYKIDMPTCQPNAQIMKEELMEGNTYKFLKGDVNTGITIEYKKLVTPISYNSFTVTKYDCSPLKPAFNGKVPLILINKVTFAKTVMTQFTGLVTLELSKYANNLDLLTPKAFYRSSLDSGVFEELPTVYDKTTNTISFTIYGTGEICIGDYFDNSPTIGTQLITPRKNSILNKNKDVKFTWSPNGRYNSNKLIIYKKVNNVFEKMSEKDSIRTTSFTQPVNIFNDTEEYGWQVISSNDFGAGQPSAINEFRVKDSYISMVSPNGGEKLMRDSISYVIKWDDNLDDLVRIELMNGSQVTSKIADSLQSQLNNIKWKIPANIPVGTNYKIKVSSIKDANLTTMSKDTFEIEPKPNSVDDDYTLQGDISIFPNPVSDYLNVEVQNFEPLKNFEILNIFGEKVLSVETQNFVSQQRIDVSTLPAGVYFLKLGNQAPKKFIKI